MSYSLAQQSFENFQKQLMFLGIGLLSMLFISTLDWRVLRNHSFILLFLYGIGLLLLIGLFVFAPETRGTQGWYRIGGISMDPIEFMKFVLIVLMAKYFSSRHREMYRVVHIILSGIYFAVPLFLIYRQPNLGSAFVLFALWVSILLVSGIKLRHFILLILAVSAVFSIGWNFVLQDYQKSRLLSFVEPELDPLGIGWSQLQSKIAIGNGGIFGQGFGQGSQIQYHFLSEPHTDFIFASIGEEFGLFGLSILFLLYALLLWRIFQIGIRAQSNFPRLFAIGFASVIVAQFVVHIGMNLGLLPIVGLSLPFVSYGGSSLLFSYMMLGFLQSMAKK
ncbi:MAG: FtsW/RodA/SpoVE family cell cycle protein [Candidatus Wildermuthbacteria bacterium]|nr:FtsW/RodA/SpoVE family cell cycle protein [Candidatus Wildermuthbacteria bacterium]